ncbi:MAG: nucleotidyltransferase domain-containing protein [bacterium]
MDETTEASIVKTVLKHFPAVQGIYLFGSCATGNEWPQSDVDIALLLPHEQSKTEKNLLLSECRFDLEKALHKQVDLLNARQVSTVFQKEIIAGKCIHVADRDAVEEFEMLTLSKYQKLNEERREILEDFQKTGRAYKV